LVESNACQKVSRYLETQVESERLSTLAASSTQNKSLRVQGLRPWGRGGVCNNQQEVDVDLKLKAYK